MHKLSVEYKADAPETRQKPLSIKEIQAKWIEYMRKAHNNTHSFTRGPKGEGAREIAAMNDLARKGIIKMYPPVKDYHVIKGKQYPYITYSFTMIKDPAE